MLRFSIKDVSSQAEKEGDTYVRFTGKSPEPFFRVSERACRKVGLEPNGDPKLSFVTGLDETQVPYFKWYTEDERKEVLKQIKNLKPLIVNFFGGEEVVNAGNKFFWKENRDVNRLSLNNAVTDDVFYDTKNPNHALLYLSIISGAFIDTVAPTKKWAEDHQIQHYLALETDDTTSDEDNNDLTRSDAHAALADLRNEESSEALFILAWCIQYDTNTYGAYLKSTSLRDLISYHIKYIDGKLVTKKKRNTPKTFLEYYKKWKGQQTRPLLYTEAYVKAGEFYSFLNQRDKKYTTMDGTILGSTVDQAVENLMKPKFAADYEKLRDQVENKWKE